MIRSLFSMGLSLKFFISHYNLEDANKNAPG